MKKKLITGAAAVVMAAVISMTSFAGQWQQDAAGWWYQNDDGSYINNGWNWVDGKCYYFMPNGYCLTGTQTPDGYTVDENGAWVVNGVVQTQAADPANAAMGQEVIQVDVLTFTVPAGFVFRSSEDGMVFYSDASDSTVIALISENYYEGNDENILAAYEEQLMDQELGVLDGVTGAKSIKQFPTGHWYCYDYPVNTVKEIPGSIRVYGRIVGSKVQAVFFAGALSGMDTDSIMYNNIR